MKNEHPVAATPTDLIRYDAARFAVAECRSVDEAKGIADKAAAMKAYARQRNDLELMAWVAEIQLRARRRIGELSSELERGHGPGRGKTSSSDGKSFKTEAIKNAGLSVTEAHRCEQISRVPEREFERVISERRDQGRAVTAAQKAAMC